MLIDTSRQEFVPGEDKTGDGTALNVRALYQRCPHLGCKPNPCLKNFWLECPCHGSRYDRLGTKALGPAYGPAPRGLDRFATVVKDDQSLYVDTLKITLGPLPVALGQPGLIPPKSPDRLHLTAVTDRRRSARSRMTDRPGEPEHLPEPTTAAAGPAPAERARPGRALRRAPERPPAGAHPRAGGGDRPPERERPLGRLPGRR